MRHDSISVRTAMVRVSQGSHVEFRYNAVLKPHVLHQVLTEGPDVYAHKIYGLLSIRWECHLRVGYDISEEIPESKWLKLKTSALERLGIL